MHIKSRSDIAKEESTRDPIFLVQKRAVVLIMGYEAGYSSDQEMYYDRETNECLSDDDLIERDCAFAVWRTVSVTMTRAQGEEIGNQLFPKNRFKKGIDWMVYCIPCAGYLAELLRKQDEE